MSKPFRHEASDLYRAFCIAQAAFRVADPSRSYKNVVGDLGERVACDVYGLKLARDRGADAVDPEGRMVEIKARTNWTGKVEIKKDCKAALLLVLLFEESGQFHEIYYGPMAMFFQNAKFVARTNDYQLSITALRRLGEQVAQRGGK